MRRKNQDSPQAFRHVPAHNIPIDAVREIHQVFHRIWHPIEKGGMIHVAAGNAPRAVEDIAQDVCRNALEVLKV